VHRSLGNAAEPGQSPRSEIGNPYPIKALSDADLGVGAVLKVTAKRAKLPPTAHGRRFASSDSLYPWAPGLSLRGSSTRVEGGPVMRHLIETAKPYLRS